VSVVTPIKSPPDPLPYAIPASPTADHAAKRFQTRSAAVACISIVPAVIGMWLFNASQVDSHNAALETPGAILAILGILGTIGGMLAFAYGRLRA